MYRGLLFEEDKDKPVDLVFSNVAMSSWLSKIFPCDDDNSRNKVSSNETNNSAFSPISETKSAHCFSKSGRSLATTTLSN